MGTYIKAGYLYVDGPNNTPQTMINNLNASGTAAKVFTQRTESGVPTYYFMDSGNASYYLTIKSGATLTLGSSNSVGLNFRFSSLANDRLRLTISDGGTLNIYSPTFIDVSYGHTNSYRGYFFIYGNINISGTIAPSTSRYPQITHAYSLYLIEDLSNNIYNNITWKFTNCVFSNMIGNGIYINHMFKYRGNLFLTNVLFSGASSTSFVGQTFYLMYSDYTNFENFKINNCRFYNIRTNCIQTISFGEIYNCTFDTRLSDNYGIWSQYGRAPINYSPYNYTYINDKLLKGTQNLGIYIHDNIFCNSGTNQSCVASVHGSVCLLAKNQFNNTTDYTSYSQYKSEVRYWSGNTFPNSYWYINNEGAITKYVNRLKLRIVDQSNNPISGAKVCAYEKNNKECYNLYTNGNGYLIAEYGLSGVFLTWRMFYGNTTSASYGTSYETWSSGSTGGHYIEVFKEGYRPFKQTYIMGRERDETIVLQKLDSYSYAF